MGRNFVIQIKPCGGMICNASLFHKIPPWFDYVLENIALHKNAWQLRPYRLYMWSASNAVDGLKTNFSAFGGQCTISANKQYEAVWRVDLGAVLGIHHITIYYRTGNYPWGMYHNCMSIFLNFRNLAQIPVSC